VTTWETLAVAITTGGTYSWTLLPPAPTTGDLEITNSSSLTITELYVALSSARTWGPDQLAGTIAPSGTFTLIDIAPGTYDFQAVASDGTTAWEVFDVVITAGEISSWALLPPAPTTGDLLVNKDHCVAITELYVAPSSGT